MGQAPDSILLPQTAKLLLSFSLGTSRSGLEVILCGCWVSVWGPVVRSFNAARMITILECLSAFVDLKFMVFFKSAEASDLPKWRLTDAFPVDSWRGVEPQKNS